MKSYCQYIFLTIFHNVAFNDGTSDIYWNRVRKRNKQMEFRSICFQVVETTEVLYKKELQQSRFYRNRAHSNCSFVSLRSFRKVHVQHAFLINDVKIHDVIVIT